MVYANLKAEMARREVTLRDLAAAAGKSERSVRDKVNGKRPLTLPELESVRRCFFPDLSLDYLAGQATVDLAESDGI